MTFTYDPVPGFTVTDEHGRILPDPYAIRLWLPVRRSDGAASTLYVKTIRTAHTPRPDGDSGYGGDPIHLWAGTDTRVEINSYVKKVYWDHTGRCNVDLHALTVNPTPEAREHARSLRIPMIPWVGDDPTALRVLLTGAGWTEWNGES